MGQQNESRVYGVAGASAVDRRVADANHRIGNNLSVIGGLVRQRARAVASASPSYSAAEVSRILGDVSRKIDMVGRLHRLLAASGDGVELGGYLHEIAAGAISSLSPAGDVELEPLASDGCKVHASQALLIGFIVEEVATNAIKYAHPARVKGRISMSCVASGAGTEVTLADDGVGFPEGFDPRRAAGEGLRMVTALAGQLKATISFDSTELGLTVRLWTPPRAEADISRLAAAGSA